MKYAWIASNKKQWPVSMACEMLGVSTSGYFENMRRKGADKPSKPGANKRISNILKKAPDVDAHVSPLLLREPAEIALHAAMQDLAPQAQAQFEAGDYTASLKTLAALRLPVDDFFDAVMVNAEELDLRLNRQGLLKSLHQAMNRVADLSKLVA